MAAPLNLRIMAIFASVKPWQKIHSFMKYRSRLLLLLPLLLLFNACKTDFDVTAPYKEITIVYGLLSQNDTTHYLRINKAFLGNGNALQYATVADSSFYGNDIEVTVTESTTTGIGRTLAFDTTTIHTKDSGIFYSPDQLMYRSTAVLDPKNTYALKIRNKKSGSVVSSSTVLVQDFAIKKPISGSKWISFKRATTSPQKFEWYTGVNGRLYQPILKFYFKETSQASDTLLREIDWVFPSYKSTELTGGELLATEYLNEDFYTWCEAQIPYKDAAAEDAVKNRLADHFDLTFTVVGDEFSTYLDVNGPSTGLLLEKPFYSNIENGIGLFSSRFLKHRTAQVAEDTKADLQNTTDLKFFAN